MGSKRPMTAGQMRAAAGVPEAYPPEWEPGPGSHLIKRDSEAQDWRTIGVVLSELEFATDATREAAVANAIGMLRALLARNHPSAAVRMRLRDEWQPSPEGGA